MTGMTDQPLSPCRLWHKWWACRP